MCARRRRGARAGARTGRERALGLRLGGRPRVPPALRHVLGAGACGCVYIQWCVHFGLAPINQQDRSCSQQAGGPAAGAPACKHARGQLEAASTPRYALALG